MGRQKSTDPTQALTIRLKLSALEWWEHMASKKAESVRKTIQDALESKAEKENQK